MICDTLRNLAHATWNKIDDARRVGFQLKEETFTDINLLELKLQHPTQIITHEFTKFDEGVNGADWEWWFTDEKEWIGFRVQAKIISIKSDKFEHLHYQNRASAHQSEILITRAEDDITIPRYPIYCLFLSTEHLDDSPIYTPLKLYGCSLMSAYTVKEIRAKKTCHVKELQKYLLPWHELVCHSNTESLLKRVKYVAEKFFGNPRVSSAVNTMTVAVPPAYVMQLYMASDNNSNFEEAPDGLAGVVIINTNH